MDWHSLAGWKRLVLMGAMVCLPIPMLAASGLAVPLPTVVYRVAVGVAERTQAVAVHVPGFDEVVAETKQVARRGTIRLSAEELAVAHPPVQTPAADQHRSEAADRARRSTRPAVHRPEPKERAARAVKVKSVAPSDSRPEHATRAVAAPAAEEATRASDSPGREEHPAAKKDSRPVETSHGETSAGPSRPAETRASPPQEEPKGSPPKEERTNAPSDLEPVPPPPPRPTPPSSVPPLPVTPPIDPLPEPVSLAPKATLEEIAAELREIAAKDDDDAFDETRVGQAEAKVRSAVRRLDKTPPDSQGAVGDIKNAVQKLDTALAEGEIDAAQRTSFVTRLTAVSERLKVLP